MTAPKPGTPLTSINFSVADDGYTECTDHRRAYETSCRLEQDRARLIGALKELHAAENAPYPAASCGEPAQTAWCERKHKANEEAVFILRELGELE